jgi:outer membrane protein assembly factor BamB
MMQTRQWLGHTLLALMLAGLVSCGSTPSKPKPGPLPSNPATIGVQQAWVTQVGPVLFPMHMHADEQSVTLASGQGDVMQLDAQSGAALWRTALQTPLAAGVGSDGRYAAVVSRDNVLIALDRGREMWRANLGAQVFTSPLVAGLRVFVLDAERRLSAFDARSGRRLWQLSRRADALVLRQAGVLMAVGDTLVMGVSGHLQGVNPNTGAVVWDATVAAPRSTNDIERLVDVVDGVARSGQLVCVRAFQAAVGCVDASTGKVRWTQVANGFVGLSGDGSQVYGVEASGQVKAWALADGKQVWTSQALQYRRLSAPLLLGRSVALGDEAGLVHLLSRADGSVMNRVGTDGSAIELAPVLAGETLVVVSRNGGVFGFRPR